MSANLIIYVTGKPLLHGHKRREFLWSESLGLYLYGGKELAAEEFNAAYERCLKNNADMNPRVRVVGGETVSVKDPAEPLLKIDVAAPRTITLDEAEATMARLAPERLKKKTGPRAPQMATLDVA